MQCRIHFTEALKGTYKTSCQNQVSQRFTKPSPVLTTMVDRTYESIVGKGENAGNQHLLLFPFCFYSYQRRRLSFLQLRNRRLQMLAVWTSLKFCCFVNS